MLNITVIRERQIKTIRKYHSISTRLAKIRKTDNTKCGKGVEELELSYTAGGNAKWYNHFGNSLTVSYNIEVLFAPSIVTLRYLTK